MMREVFLLPHSSIEKAYHKALEIEEYLSSFISYPTPFYSTIPCFIQPAHGSIFGGSQVFTVITPTKSSTAKATFNKVYDSALSNSQSFSSHIKCHYCHDKCHITSPCS